MLAPITNDGLRWCLCSYLQIAEHAHVAFFATAGFNWELCQFGAYTAFPTTNVYQEVYSISECHRTTKRKTKRRRTTRDAAEAFSLRPHTSTTVSVDKDGIWSSRSH